MTPNFINQIIQICKNNKVPYVADSQTSSQIGDISKFHGSKLLTPTEKEIRVSLKNFDDGLIVLADKLMKTTSAENIILKLGSEGSILYVKNDKSILNTEKLPSLNRNPIDVAGAGDTLLITSAMCYILTDNPWLSFLIGNISAGIQVGN